jgi:SNF2 family DNA or RNA helicase
MNSTDTQQRAFNKLNRLKVGALFMEMGTGKTKVALDLMASKSRKCDLLLWICPCSLKATIADERAKWQPGLSLEVVGCESIGASSRIYLETLEKVKNAKCAFIVVDESLKIKNISAKRTQRILNLGKLAAYKLILNGTPLTKNALDIYTQITFLSPKILSESFQEFKRKYCEFYLKGDRKGQVKRCVNIPHLVSRIKPYIFDAKLDLNVLKNHSRRHYVLTIEEEYLYEKTKNDILDYCTENDKIDFYRLVTGLYHFLYSCESKRQAVRDLLQDIDGKAVVFVKFLASIPDGALRIVGEMSTEERTQAIEEFKTSDEQALYITYGCGAFGLNLQFVNNLVFADRTWDLAQMEQAEARIFRLGQKETEVNYYYVVTNTGLEKMLDNNLGRKTDLLKEIKNTIETMNIQEREKWLKKHL